MQKSEEPVYKKIDLSHRALVEEFDKLKDNSFRVEVCGVVRGLTLHNDSAFSTIYSGVLADPSPTHQSDLLFTGTSKISGNGRRLANIALLKAYSEMNRVLTLRGELAPVYRSAPKSNKFPILEVHEIETFNYTIVR